MQRAFAQIDVFTATPYLGNPVAVVLDGTGLSTEAMQAFTDWTHLSEATFVLPPTQAGADYALRIFCPGRELPFAGHPTLGSCHAWLDAGGMPQGSEVVQECAVGLVRHGQASFGADDYDQLSELGQRQSRRLGAYFQERGLTFEAVITGSLKRQQQTWRGIAEGMGQAELQHLVWPGLNEYDSHAVIHAIHPEPLAKPDTPELYKHHFGLLRQGLQAWMRGQAQPQGMPSYPDFVHGITSALAHVQAQHSGDVLLVSSGGPIATAVGHVLQTPPEVTIEINMRIRNTAVCEIHYTPKRLSLVSHNTINHLDGLTHQGWVTYT